MVGKDMIVMSMREVKRLKAVQLAIERHIPQKRAASMVGLSERQVRRVVKSIRERGEKGIITLPGAISRFWADPCDGEAYGARRHQDKR
jgi:DNA-binding Lrp family transcriptional regulator